MNRAVRRRWDVKKGKRDSANVAGRRSGDIGVRAARGG